MYEVLLKDRPTRLFFDLECVGVTPVVIVKKVVDLLQDYTYGSKLFSLYTYLSPVTSSAQKHSCRLIFPQAVFGSIDDDMKTFVLGFVKWLNEKKQGAGLYYEKAVENDAIERCSVINTAVYSEHQNITVYGYNTTSEKLACFNPCVRLDASHTFVQPWFLSDVQGDFCAQHIERIVYKREQEDYSRPEIKNRRDGAEECMEIKKEDCMETETTLKF